MLGAPYQCSMILMQSQFEWSSHSYLRTIQLKLGKEKYTLMYDLNTNVKSLQYNRKVITNYNLFDKYTKYLRMEKLLFKSSLLLLLLLKK